jgi:putative transposase
VYLAIGVRCSGHKEILGLWIEQTEGAKFWLRVMTEIRNRGTHDVLIAVVDGLKGFPEAINAVFPDTLVQTRSNVARTHPLPRPADRALDQRRATR